MDREAAAELLSSLCALQTAVMVAMSQQGSASPPAWKLAQSCGRSSDHRCAMGQKYADSWREAAYQAGVYVMGG